jgi:hypothetical protein
MRHSILTKNNLGGRLQIFKVVNVYEIVKYMLSNILAYPILNFNEHYSNCDVPSPAVVACGDEGECTGGVPRTWTPETKYSST